MPKLFHPIAIFTLLILISSHSHAALQQELNSPAANEVDFEKTVLPLLEKYCIQCHSPGDMESLDFMAMETREEALKHKGLFAAVYESISQQTMPPGNLDQPTTQERELILNWIQKELSLKPEDTDRIASYVVETFQAQDGSLWFGTMARGVARHNGTALTYFTKADGLPSNTVSSIAQDRQGTLWFGTHSGVAKYDGTAISIVGPEAGLPASTGSGPESSAGVNTDRKGNVWVSIGRQVFQQKGKKFVEFKLPSNSNPIDSFSILAGDASFKMEDRNGNLWFGRDGDGLYKYDGQSFEHYTKSNGLCSNTVNSIIEDRKGRIWITCMQSYQPKMTGDGGLCRFDGKTFLQFPNVKGLHKNDLYTIHGTNSGDIWIGATGVGAYRYDGKTFSLFNETDRPHWARNFGLQSMLEDRDGTLWFGFSGGLFRFNGKSFFNVGSKGPWMGCYSAMENLISGKYVPPGVLPAQMQAALKAFSNNEFNRSAQILIDFKKNSPGDPTIQEFALNEFGYRLVFNDRLEEATEIFKLNTQLYPNAFNTHDSLAESYHRRGNEQLAIENYRKSIQLNPENEAAKRIIVEIKARQRYERILVAPKDWMEEVITLPPSFAPSMKLKGLEHLRLPPEFRKTESDWFCSYLFAMELSHPTDVDEAFLSEQLLSYFRGLADGGSDKDGNRIDTKAFSIEPSPNATGLSKGEFLFVLKWREPFAAGTEQRMNIRVKLVEDQKEGVLFVCGSPQPMTSEVWNELLRIRTEFEKTLAAQD